LAFSKKSSQKLPDIPNPCSPGKARSILGLVLPQGPSLVDPLAAASVEDLEAHTVTSHQFGTVSWVGHGCRSVGPLQLAESKWVTGGNQ